jgi:hypothetical protein
MGDLERVLREVDEQDESIKRNTTEQRRFIVVRDGECPYHHHHLHHPHLTTTTIRTITTPLMIIIVMIVNL